MKRAVGGERSTPASRHKTDKEEQRDGDVARSYVGACRRKTDHVASTANDAGNIDKERWTRTVEEVAKSGAHLSFLACCTESQDTIQLWCTS